MAVDKGGPATGPPSPPVAFGGGVAGPATAPHPAATRRRTPPRASTTTRSRSRQARVDNAQAVVRIEWPTLGSDWDMRIYRDEDGDGTIEAGDDEVGSSQQGTTDFEQTTLSAPALLPGASYVVRVNNFAATEPYEGIVTFVGPPPFEPAKTESWTLTCERPNGEVLSTEQITIARGQRKTPNLSACAALIAATGTPPARRGPAQTTPACASAAILRSVRARAAGGGVRLEFSKRVSQRVNVDVFQVAVGRKVIGERLVARFRGKNRSFTWNGRSKRKRVRPGYFFARYSIKLPNGTPTSAARSSASRAGASRRGRTSTAATAAGCCAPTSSSAPTFGGSTRRPLRAAFRLTRASTVRVEVLRGTQVVKTLVKSRRFAAGRTHRATLTARGLRKGDYKVRITVRRAGAGRRPRR